MSIIKICSFKAMIFLTCPECGANNFKNAQFCSLCKIRLKPLAPKYKPQLPISTGVSSYVYSIGEKDRIWAIFCHLSALLGLIFPLGNLLGPFIIWILKKDHSYFVEVQGKEALNFQITILIAYFALGMLSVLIGKYSELLILLLTAFDGIMIFFASIKIYQGEKFYYPYNIRFFN